MMKRPEFLETKRTPRYSLRKLNVGVASVLLGVTIFGINFTDHSVKAATTTEAVVNTRNSNSTSNSVQTNPQQTENTATTYANKNNAQTAATQQNSTSNDATEKVQQSSASKNATANNSTEAATTLQSSPKTQGSAHTDIKSLAAKSAAKLAFMNLVAAPGTGTNRNAAGTVDQNNINTQLAKENQKLANDNNLTSSDNYSSNIYQGTDGKYYKIVTIYGNDYVYRAADIQANGTAFLQKATTAADTKNNIDISKEDLGNGQTRWTVTFFPNKGLQNVGSNLSGLTSAKFGIALTSDYQIVGNVDMDVISDPNQTFMSHTFEPGSSSATDWPVQNPPAVVDFSFNPKTDVDPNTGLINNSKTLPAYNNKYLQPSYYFTTDTTTGAINLWQTYFFNHRNDVKYYNAYDGSPYLGYGHDFHFNNFEIKNTTGVDGAKFGDKIIYDKLGYRLNSKNGVANSNGVVNSDNFNQAMEFKSQGSVGNSQTQFSSYVISFTTQHTDSHEVELATGWKNQQFSGISANIYSYQNTGYYNMFSRLYGEQRALTPADAADPYVPLDPKDIIPNWVPANEAMKNIHTEYLNNAQINVLRNKILNNITNPDAVNNIIKEGNSLNDAMKNLGNSIGQYDPDGSFADHKVDKTKASDRYQYAGKDEKSAYDNATNAVSNIISVENGTVNKSKGTYADQATVEQLTKDENNAWKELNGVKPKDNEVNSPIGGTITIEKGHTLDSTDAANAITNKGSLTNVKSYSWSGTPDTSKPGTITPSPKVIVTYNDNSTDEVPVTVKIKGDADKYNPEGGEIPVNRNTKLGPAEAEEAIKNAQSLPKGTTYSWAGEKLPDTSTSGSKDGWVVVTYPDTSRDIVPVKINVKKDAESYTVTPNNKVSVDKGEDVDPASLVTVTDPDGKQVQLPAGSIDWKDGAKPDLTTPGDKTGSVEVTFLDGSKKDTDVTIHVKTDAETYDPQAQPWTTTVGTTPKADEVISSTDKNGKKMPSDAKYTWKTEPNTSKTGEASGEVTVTYADRSHDDIPVTINVKDKLNDNEKYHIYGKDGLKVDKGQTLDPKDAIDVKDADGKETTLPEGSTVGWTKKPDFSQAGKDVTGEVTVTYPGPDGSKSDPVTVTVHVNGESDKYKVAPKDDVTVPRGSQVEPESTVVAQTPDGKPTSFPKGTKHEWVTKPDTDSTGKRTGVVKTTFPDGSTTTTTVSVTVEPNQSDKYDPKGPKNPDDRVPVKDPEHLTKGDKDKVKGEVGTVNPNLPKGTEVEVDDKGNATIKYPDKSTDTIPGSDLVRPETDAEKITPNVPTTKEPVADPSHLTQPEKDKVKKNVEDANKDKFPEGTKVTVGDDGTATITYPDQTDQTKSTDTIPGSDLVRPETDAEKITPNVPTTKEPVADPSHLTQPEKDKVKKNVEDANKDKFPEGTKVTVGDDGTATITYPDQTDQTKSTDTIPGSDLVRPETDADKITPNVPTTKEPVADPSHLTQPEKDKVKKNVEDANKDKFPEGTKVTVGDDGTATITYPDQTDQTKSTDTIPGSDLVRPETDAEKITPNVPTTKEPVADPSHLTQPEKDKVKKNVEDANKDKFPEGTKVTVGDDGTATITYPDQTDQTKSTDTIPGSDLVRPETDAEKITPNVPTTKEPVADPSHLTQPEKDKVKKNVEDANKDKFPEGTKVTVGDDGTATITYPDQTDQTKSTDTIPGSDLVRPETDADKITPNVPTTKEPVADPSHLTQPEKDKVKKNVEDANKDKFPEGTKVTVGDDGTATITYPDQTDQTKSTDTIPGSDLVRPETDADKITPNVPTTKEPVADPSHLTQPEKDKVKKNVEDANKDKFPEGTKVTVGDDGTATITYPDQTDQTKSTDTIPGSDLVRPETDADKITPNVPTTKEPVADPSHLTQPEKDKVKKNVEDANKDKFPEGTKVTVGDDGTATITYPDQTDQTKSTDTIPGSDLVRPETDAEKITPNVPTTKEPVADPSHLTQPEKDKVKKNVEDANKDKFPEGTKVTVGDDGTATITYPDQTDQTKSTDTIPGSDLVRPETDADKITPNVPTTKEPVADPSHLTQPEKDKVKKNVEDANKDKFPEGTKVTVGDDGTATITYPDQTDQTKSTDTIPGSDLVRPETDADKITPNVPTTKEPVADPSHLTQPEKDKVKKNVEDANKDKFPEGTKVTVGDDGTATITYPDQTDQTKSTDTIPGSDLVRPETDAEKITPNVPTTKEPVADPSHLTQPEKDKVKKNVEDANKDKFPEGTKVTVGDDGTATITYPDQTDQTKSTDTIPGSDLVRPETDADKITPNVPTTKEPVADPSHLTQPEKDKVKKNVEDANKDKFPEGTKVTVGDDGTATITYPDQTDQTKSTDTIPGSDLVRPETDAEKITPNVPTTKEPVADPSHLTQPEKDKVKKNVEDANKDKFPEGTKVTVGDDGTATITYPDQTDQTKSTDTIPGSDLVRPETDAEKITPNVPGTKVPVADPSHLTDTEKGDVKKNVEDANKGNFPDGTKVNVGDDGTATLTYPDGSKDTIPGDQLVQGQKGDTTDAGNITPNIPGGKVTVKDPSHLTDDEKNQVKNNVDNANKDKFPDGTKVTVGDDGTTTVTYPDGSKDTIPGDQLVQGQKGDTTDAGNITPNIPGGKVTVKDPSHLTDDEKNQVKNNVDNANKDKFPDGTKVTVGDDGTTTVTYPDGSKDTIPGDQLVQGQKGDTTDAGNITPNIPGGKVTVKDPSHLTDDEKNQVKNNVDNANKDKFPDGTKVTVGDDGTTTVTYLDGSKDTIPGDQLVQGQKGDTTDAGNITPNIPGGKVTVKDPSHLTDDEKNQVKNNVNSANKDKFPAGTEVTVGDDGTATIKYPDGSKDTISGDQLVQGQKGDTTDAGNIAPTISGGKVTVKDPSHLTDDEKNQVKNNVDSANKDKFPAGTEVTVGDDGTATIKYPDGSKDTISGDQLVQGQKGDTTDAGNIAPTISGGKVTVKDPSHLTDDEKNQVKNNVDSANKDKFPAGTEVTVGDDGTATITYPDGSKDTIPGRDLIKGISGNKHDSNSSSGSNGTISNTDDETSGDTVNNAESMNGNTAKSGSKNNSLKTLPQTGTKDVTILEILGLFLSLFGLLGLKKKHHEE
ncbi:LEA family epithelial adhesin [Limosilactobacillus reuteri]|uniref:LEA family epithelial adhesin n=1 Tax=Limosilactobacillus reuteri TaxID=1598 RepID=UPI00235EF92A|nr:LEA family epithelial adhesin [Limosilactobacillus reuteri]MDD1407575.1 LEA family epithelial adhesin [Limosilactobacillus reuteri]